MSKTGLVGELANEIVEVDNPTPDEGKQPENQNVDQPTEVVTPTTETVLKKFEDVMKGEETFEAAYKKITDLQVTTDEVALFRDKYDKEKNLSQEDGFKAFFEDINKDDEPEVKIEPIKTILGNFGAAEETVGFKEGDVSKYIKEKYDFDLKDNKSVDDLFTQMKQSAEEVIATKKLLQEQTDYGTFFKNMPVDLKSVVVDYGDKKDYKTTAKAVFSELDLQKESNLYNTDELVFHYNKGISKEDWEEKEDKDKDFIRQSAVAQYNSERALHFSKIDKFETNVDTQKTNLLASAEKSISNLKAKFPSLTNEKLESIKIIMLDGFATELYTQENLFKEDAAEKVTTGKFGSEVIANIVDGYKNYIPEKTKKALKVQKEESIKHLNNQPPSSQSDVQKKTTDSSGDLMLKVLEGKSGMVNRTKRE